MEYGRSKVVLPELNKRVDPYKDRSIPEDLFYNSNLLVNHLKNQTGKLYDKSEGERDPNFSWTSPETYETLRQYPIEIVNNLSPMINNAESLRAALERQKEVGEGAAHLVDTMGVWPMVGASIVAGSLSPEIVIGGSAVQGLKVAATLSKLSNKAAMGFGVASGAALGVGEMTAWQASNMSHNKNELMIAGAFGGAVGTLVGWHMLKQPVEALGNGETSITRVAKALQDTPPDISPGSGHTKTTFGTVITPSKRLSGSDDESVRGWINSMSNPSVALRDKDGNVIPATTYTAEDYKAEYGREHIKTQYAHNVEFDTAVKEQGYKGNLQQFHTEGLSHYRNAESKAAMARDTGMPSKLPELEPADVRKYLGKEEATAQSLRTAKIRKYRDENPLKIDYSHSNPMIAKFANTEAGYYNYMAVELRASGMKGAQFIRPEGYSPSTFAHQKLDSIDPVTGLDFTNTLAQSLVKNAKNIDSPITWKEALESAEATRTSVKLNKTMEPIRGGSQRTQATNRRSLQYYRGDMNHFLHSDGEEIMAKYSFDFSGRLAVQKKLGFDSATDFVEDIKKKFAHTTETQKKDMQVVFDTLVGTREIPHVGSLWDTTLRLATKVPRVVFSPGFAAIGVTELAIPIGSSGLKHVMKALIPSFVESMNMIRGKSIKDPLVKEFLELNLVGDVLSSRTLQRFDSPDTYQTPATGMLGSFEHMLDKVNHGIHKYGGLGYITEVGHLVSIISGANKLRQLAMKGAGNLSKAETRFLARIGIDDLEDLRKNFEKATVKNGVITKMNHHKWNQDTLRRMTTALNRHAESTILKPDGTNMPVFMSDPNSPIAKMTLQFTRYPIAAHEKLMAKGFDEMEVNQIIALLTQFSLFIAVSQAKDLIRPDDKKLYDLDTDEGAISAMGYALSQSYGIGISGMIVDKLLGLMGISLSGHYSPNVVTTIAGPAGAVELGLQKTAQSIGKKILDPDKELKIHKSANPLAHNIVSGLLIKMATED